MKPRTIIQKTVASLMHKVPPITESQKAEAIKKVAPHLGKVDSKGMVTCLDCGHKWKSDSKFTEVCPCCSLKLEIKNDRSRTYKYRDSFMIVTTCHGFQVLRIFLIKTYLKKDEKAKHEIHEIFQRWITGDGQCVIVGLKRCMSCYCDAWVLDSGFEIRKETFVHSLYEDQVIGRVSVISELKRNGFDGNFHHCNPHHLLTELLTNNKIETLWKIGRFKLAGSLLCRWEGEVDEYWKYIKIAIRHKYDIADYSIWRDMISYLIELGKDAHNPKYLCPENLLFEHQSLLMQANKKRKKARLKTELELFLSNVENAEAEEAEYRKSKGKYLNLEFTDKEITIKPLSSVIEFIHEGSIMHHCVYRNRYYKEQDSLILHALIDGKSIATIEFDLKNMTVTQCRGVNNSVPEMKDRIMSLMYINSWQIAQASAA